MLEKMGYWQKESEFGKKVGCFKASLGSLGLKKLEDAGYRASERKSEFFLNSTKWLGHEIDETGIKPNKEKVKAILELKHPENQKQLKSFLGAIQ